MPAEPLWDVFTPQALDTLRKRSPADQRLAVLASGGLNTEFPNRLLRKDKAAWEAYLTAAFVCGLFEGDSGADLRARLTSPDVANFRGAMSECLAVWFIAGKRRLPVRARPEGAGRSILEFAIVAGNIEVKVEVKAPFRELDSSFFWGDDSDALEGALTSANRQFRPDEVNLLVIVPSLRLDIFPLGNRRPIEKAFIGEDFIQIPIDTRTGGPAGPHALVFKEVGRLTKRWPEPRYTRVGAALLLGEIEGRDAIEHRALLVRNPNAINPVGSDLFSGVPEFRLDGQRWRWSDDE